MRLRLNFIEASENIDFDIIKSLREILEYETAASGGFVEGLDGLSLGESGHGGLRKRVEKKGEAFGSGRLLASLLLVVQQRCWRIRPSTFGMGFNNPRRRRLGFGSGQVGF